MGSPTPDFEEMPLPLYLIFSGRWALRLSNLEYKGPISRFSTTNSVASCVILASLYTI